MIRRFHKWVVDTFLPKYCYEALRDDLAATEKKLQAARQTIEMQEEIICNLRYALRWSGKVQIKIEGAVKDDTAQ